MKILTFILLLAIAFAFSSARDWSSSAADHWIRGRASGWGGVRAYHPGYPSYQQYGQYGKFKLLALSSVRNCNIFYMVLNLIYLLKDGVQNNASSWTTQYDTRNLQKYSLKK
ncbi:unnamed protein product [Strongylus vulgaris]|uniref:Uncharacterized protein n=1 Tax=Strongylus vulgaris TaxID=40348 RepID=A0A3P7I0N0_STRVU|nr:unnamed protein product [Strongylus vulgaris]